MTPLSRRAALATLLGSAPAALLHGCGKPPSSLDGEIVGQSDALGHRLQQGWRPQPAPDAWQTTKVVIVGGGIAGLSAAWRLRRAGFTDFVLLELEREAGGTSRSGRSDVCAYPWGAHYVPAPQKENAALVCLLTEMGVVEGTDAGGDPIVGEQFLCRAPQERIAYKGRWYEGLYLHAGASAEDLRQFDAFQKEVDHWVAWRDGRGRRAFAIPTSAGSDDPDVRALDTMSMAEFLARKGLTSERLRWYVDYACRDDYGTFLADTTAWAGLFYFASRVPKPGEEAEPLLTWPEGNGRLVAYLLNAVSAQARLGVAATEVIPVERDGRSRVDVTALERASQRAIGFHADRVVFAAPQFLAQYLIRPYREQPPAHVFEFHYAPWLVANLTLREHPGGLGFPLCWDNVFYESPSLGYVVATHQLGLECGPTVLTYYHAFCEANVREARARLLDGTWQQWAEAVLADVARVHPDIRTLVERLDVVRWGHAMVRPRTGFVWSLSRRKAAEPYRGIHFAHADLSGIALFEEAYYHGLRAAEEVLCGLGAPPAERFT